MNQIRFRQIARLEQRALPYITRAGAISEQSRNIRRGAVAHAAVLVFLVRYGNPQVNEPLSDACRRAAESEAWKSCCEKFPEYCEGYLKNLFEPYDNRNVSIVGDPLRHVLISTLVGSDEKDKLNGVFKSLPPWLVWFTFADYTAKLLGLDLPDLSTVTGFERSKEVFFRLWGLPEGAFECRSWPHGTNEEPLARTDLSLLEMETDQHTPITNRERKRALANSARSRLTQPIDWPHLSSEEWLHLDLQTKAAILRKAGHFGGEVRRRPEFCGIAIPRPRSRGRR